MLYEIVATSNMDYQGMILPLPDGLKVGDIAKVIGAEFIVRQAGKILTITNKNDAITMRVKDQPIEIPKVLKIDNPKYLRINKEIDLFFDTKEIRLNVGIGNLTEEHGLTYDALFKFLVKEWQTIASAFPEQAAAPMEHEPNTNNYCLINGWNWAADYNLLLKDGCWSRKNEQGRHV